MLYKYNEVSSKSTEGAVVVVIVIVIGFTTTYAISEDHR